MNKGFPKILTLIADSGLKIGYISEQVGIERTRLSKLLHGRVGNVQAWEIEAIANFFGVRKEDLL